MATIPGFITGANARILLGKMTLGYCTDVSYTINVATVPVEAMGKYEVFSNEPVAYTIDGSFSVIRYTKQAFTAGLTQGADTADTADDIKIGEHLNPANILASKTFKLEIHQVSAQGVSADETKDPVSGAITKAYTPVFIIEDCRIVRRGSTLNKRGVMVDNYAFVAVIGGDANNDGTLAVSNSFVSGTNVV